MWCTHRRFHEAAFLTNSCDKSSSYSRKYDVRAPLDSSLTIRMTSVANTALTEPIHHLHEKLERDSISPEPSGRRPNVVFEDFLYYAAIQRMEEDGGRAPQSNWFTRLSEHKGRNVNVDVTDAKPPPMTEDEEEAANASRALRLASWAAVFYLITTDILGPFNAPFAISQVGWVPGKAHMRFSQVNTKLTRCSLLRCCSLFCKYVQDSFGDWPSV